MESYMELTQSKDNQNWYKTLIGLHITKEGLVDFVIDVMKCFHRQTFDNINRINGRPIGTVCKMCSKKDLKSPHYVCPNNICVEFYKRLKQEARGREISWSNTDPTKWCTDFWEVAKCFLPPEGYRDANCPQETDFNGIVNLIANCRQFETHFADDLTKASNKCIKARKIANNARHSSSLQIDDITLQENLDTMKDLLWDSKRLATDPKAKSAATKLTKLENDQLLMTEADIRTVVRITTEGLSDKIEELRSFEKSLLNYMEEVQKNVTQCGIQEQVSNVYENKKSGLRTDLHEFNSEMHCTSSISPMIQGKRSKIVDFYVAPSIETISTNRRYSCKGDHISGKGSVSTFREIFYFAKGKSRYVYVSAKAGAGKTAFCQYVAAIWCALQRNDKEEIQTFKNNNKTGHFEDICVLKEYDFLFFVSLREIRDQLCDVDDMIFQQIVTNLSGGHMYDPSLLKEILRNESCLIVIDGLDEWKHPISCKVQPNNIPHFKVRPNCTCLITSRPWKLSECRLKESDLTVCIEINGIKGVRNDLLTEYVTSCLNSKYGKAKDVAEFRKLMESSFLETQNQNDSILMGSSIANICSIPVMLMHILCLWYDDVSFGKSKCETYCNMISLLFEMANMDTSMEYNGDFELICSDSLPNCILENKVCTENSSILVGLGRLAFKTLFAESREDTVTFTEDIVNECFMNSEVSIESLLKIGILSRCTITCNASSQPVRCSFLHKSYQEMLCALFVSSLDVTSPEKPSVFKRMEDCLVDLDRIFDMSEIFVFICGMNAELAKLFSEKISDSCSYCLSKNFNEYQNGQMTKALQEMMSSGLEESKNNGFLQTEIIFKHVYLDDSTHNVHLGAIVDFNINRITTLYTKHYGNTQKVIEIINNSHHCLKYMSLSNVTFECQEERVFTYDQLSILSLRDSIVNGPLQLCCPHVSTCEIEHVQIQEDVDFSACHQLSVIQLKNVTIGGMLKASSCFHLWSLCLKGVSFSGLIDLSFCSQLSILKVEDVILPGNLDLSSCPQIIRIKLKNVTLKGSIDISSCPKLSVLKVKNVNFDGTLCLPARSQLNCLKLENITMNSDLNLFSCVELSSLKIQNVSLDGKLDLRSCPQLTSLKLEMISLEGTLDLSACPLLNALKLKNFTIEESLEINGLPALTSLVLQNVNVSGYLDLSCERLRHLKLNNVHLDGELKLSSCCLLEEVEIWGAKITGEIDFTSCSDIRTLKILCSKGGECGLENIRLNVDFSRNSRLDSLFLDTVELKGPLEFAMCHDLSTLEMSNVTFSGTIDLSCCHHLSSVALTNLNISSPIVFPKDGQLLKLRCGRMTFATNEIEIVCNIKKVHFHGVTMQEAFYYRLLSNIRRFDGCFAFSCAECVLLCDNGSTRTLPAIRETGV